MYLIKVLKKLKVRMVKTRLGRICAIGCQVITFLMPIKEGDKELGQILTPVWHAFCFFAAKMHHSLCWSYYAFHCHCCSFNGYHRSQSGAILWS